MKTTMVPHRIELEDILTQLGGVTMLKHCNLTDNDNQKSAHLDLLKVVQEDFCISNALDRDQNLVGEHK